VSDHDTKFTSKFWTELHQLLGVKLKMTTAFHPEGDGQAERMVQNVVQVIRAAVRPDQHDWILKVLLTEFAINSSISASTGFALFELIYRTMPRMMVEIPPTELPGVSTFAQQVLDNLQGAHNTIIRSRVKQLVQANRHRRQDSPKLKVGDLAYLSTKDLNLPKGRAKKLLPKYVGPYEILDAFEDSSNYMLKLPLELFNRGIHPKFHVSRLAPHEPNDSLIFPGRAAQVFYDFGEDPEREYQVQEILDHAWDTGDSLWFRIKWGLGDLTWEPLSNCDELSALDDYLILHGVDEVESLSKESRFPSPPT
jgi:hypothetical protein